MKVKKNELLSVLEKVKPGILKTSFMEGMSYFFFSGDNVITYNDKISIQHKFKTDFELFVKANDLYKILSKLSVDDINIGEKDGKLNISCKKLKANLATINDSEVKSRIDNVTNSLKKAKWKQLPGNFCHCISLCMFTASKQESDGTLTCVYVNGNDVITSDNNRISHAVLDDSVDEMFIKASEVKNLISIDPVKYSATKSWLHFKNDSGCIFSINNISGKFPDCMQFFDFGGIDITLPNDILEGVDITSIVADVLDPVVDLKISNGFCMVSVSSDSGSVSHRSKIDYKGDDISFSVNPEFLSEMMNYSSSIVVGDGKVRLKTKNFSLLTLLYA